jgi:hypothetical protein
MMPMIATTISSSIRVNPFWLLMSTSGKLALNRERRTSERAQQGKRSAGAAGGGMSLEIAELKAVNENGSGRSERREAS